MSGSLPGHDQFLLSNRGRWLFHDGSDFIESILLSDRTTTNRSKINNLVFTSRLDGRNRTLVRRGHLAQLSRTTLLTRADVEVIGEAAGGEEAVLNAEELKPDPVLLVVRMPRLSGLNAALELKTGMLQIRVMMLSDFDLQAYRKAAMVSGAMAYVVKIHILDDAVPAIRGTS